MTKIDRRKAYYLTLDTETANTSKSNMDDPMVYDLGYAVHDKYGNIYETNSLVIADIYCGERELMKTAYYADKLPKYEKALANGDRKMVSLLTARQIIKEVCAKYNIKAIIAHNSKFDYKALNQTLRYVTKSKYRYFLPFGIPVYDSQKMAKDTICKQSMYRKFCEKHNLFTRTGRLPENAQVLYAYITNTPDFKEEHQGLDDVMIEVAISTKCFRQHKAMKKLLFAR